MMDGRRWIQVMLVCGLVILQLQSSGWLAECRPHNKTHHHKTHSTTTTTTTTEPPSTQEEGEEEEDGNNSDSEGESRVAGGFLNKNVPAWLGIGLAEKNIEDNPHNRFAGHLIGLGGDYALTHRGTMDALLASKPFDETDCKGDHVCGIKTAVMETISEGPGLVPFLHPETGLPPSRLWDFPAPEKFNTEEYETSREYTSIKNEGALADHLPFNILKVSNDGDTQYERNFAAPKLERNLKEFGSDCKAYGYSPSPITGSRAGEDLSFVSIPIMRSNNPCDNGVCSLSVGGDIDSIAATAFCGGKGDLNMPVVCGQEEKLTYLLSGSSESEQCSGRFKAYHVPSMIDNIRTKLPEFE